MLEQGRLVDVGGLGDVAGARALQIRPRKHLLRGIDDIAQNELGLPVAGIGSGLTLGSKRKRCRSAASASGMYLSHCTSADFAAYCMSGTYFFVYMTFLASVASKEQLLKTRNKMTVCMSSSAASERR